MKRYKLFESDKDIDRLLEINEPRSVLAGHYEICLIRLENHIIAFHNQCPHMGEQLSPGVVNSMAEIVCPLHSYKFSLMSGEEESQRCPDLKFVAIEFEANGVFLIL